MNQPAPGPTPAVSAPMNKQELEEVLSGIGEPRIVRGMLEAWPAWGKWSFSWLAENHGDVEVPVEWLYYSADDSRAGRIGRVQRMKIAEYLERLPTADFGDAGYVIGGDLFTAIPGLIDDLQFPRYHRFDSLVERLAFIGGRGTYTQLHYDRAHNLHGVLAGRKRWQMWSPDKTPDLRPLPYQFPWSVGSHLDVVTDSDFSREEIASPDNLPGGLTPDFDFYLERGDVLVIPYGWWHRVITEEPSIAVNYWWWNGDLLKRFAPGLIPEILRDRLSALVRKQDRRGYYEVGPS